MIDRNGFTLIEIAAVLVIIALLSTLAVKRMGNVGISAYSEADRLISDLRYAQSLSMTRTRNVAVKITLSPDGWKWEFSEAGLRFADGEKSRTARQRVSFSAGAIVTFMASSGKADSDHTITLQRGSNSIVVKVYEETGYAEIE